jgi:hypothetical protein
MTHTKDFRVGFPTPAFLVGTRNNLERDLEIFEEFLSPGRLGSKVYHPWSFWHDQHPPYIARDPEEKASGEIKKKEGVAKPPLF